MRTMRGPLAALVVIVSLCLAPIAAMGVESDGKPVITPQPVSVNAGDTFDLEVSIQAWADANYTVTFQNRSRFSFPGPRNETQSMTTGDAILFRVGCEVEDGAPDGDFPLAFKVTWEVNGTEYSEEGELRVTVGEGAGTDEFPCESMAMVATVSVLAFSMLMVSQRAGRGRRH
jgi:hypothetical protein